jgi:prepilin-type N-terminal cleavage/methylation domain-containing protein
MKMTNVSPHNGFTLVELMVAAAASLILIGIIISSLVSFQQMSQGLDDKLKQEAEVQRALQFIAADIQEGNFIREGTPTSSGQPILFEVVRPDKSSSTIRYFIRAPRTDDDWSGPRIIYRRDSLEKKSYALIDQIADKSPQKCTGAGTAFRSSVGFSLFIDNNSKATVCIRGYLKDNPDGIEGSIQAATRVRAEP